MLFRSALEDRVTHSILIDDQTRCELAGAIQVVRRYIGRVGAHRRLRPVDDREREAVTDVACSPHPASWQGRTLWAMQEVAGGAARSSGHPNPVSRTRKEATPPLAVAGAPPRTAPARPSTPAARPETSGLCGQPAPRLLLARIGPPPGPTGCPETPTTEKP